jgi:hypothetical protein
MTIAAALAAGAVGGIARWWGGRIPGGACVALAFWLAWLYGPLLGGSAP